VAGGKGRINLTVCVIARLIQGAKPHSKPRFESWYPNRVSELSMVGPLVLGARHTLSMAPPVTQNYEWGLLIQ
jgi:hypothetical protein